MVDAVVVAVPAGRPLEAVTVTVAVTSARVVSRSSRVAAQRRAEVVLPAAARALRLHLVRQEGGLGVVVIVVVVIRELRRGVGALPEARGPADDAGLGGAAARRGGGVGAGLDRARRRGVVVVIGVVVGIGVLLVIDGGGDGERR